jgi:NAD(P)-dependent dehydrogenase (short-subunit alcohol dehydrogenase family)
MTRSIIVTGGFGALGRSVSAAFLAQGDRVARVDSAESASNLLAGALDLGGRDLTDLGAARNVVADVLAAFGSIDVLINLAGGFVWQTLADGGGDTWTRMFGMNTLTCLNTTKAALPELLKKKDARIVNVGAGSAVTASAGMGGYAASKAAVHKLTESLSAELAGDDITVNAVLPSIIDTPANRADMPDADIRQWVQPHAIADVILFLASPASRAINGALIPITRGG